MKKKSFKAILLSILLNPIILLNSVHSQGNSQSQTSQIPVFGGPNSVGETLLSSGDGITTPQYRSDIIENTFIDWFSFKKKLQKKYNLSVGFDYQTLLQRQSSDTGEKQATGGVFRAYASWTLLGENTKNTGTLVAKVENRHRLSGSVAPQNLGLNAGAVSITGSLFGDYNDKWGLTNLYWQQKLEQGRTGIAVGQVDVTDWLDPYGLMNPLTAFQNLSFSTNPTIAAPNQGIGIVAGRYITNNIYLLGSVIDANADATKPNLKVFQTGETFKHIEIGYTSGIDRAYLDNIHLAYWQVDKRDAAGIPEDQGIAFSVSWLFENKWLPFLRAGWSEGKASLVRTSISAGLGYLRQNRDLAAIGINWSKPENLDDQLTMEAFYRFQLDKNFALTTDLQHIIHPAQSTEDSLTVVGIRARLSM